MLDEQGYVLFVRKNALQILIPKFGLEGTVYIPEGSPFTFNEEVTINYLGLIIICYKFIMIISAIEKRFGLCLSGPNCKL